MFTELTPGPTHSQNSRLTPTSKARNEELRPQQGNMHHIVQSWRDMLGHAWPMPTPSHFSASTYADLHVQSLVMAPTLGEDKELLEKLVLVTSFSWDTQISW